MTESEILDILAAVKEISAAIKRINLSSATLNKMIEECASYGAFHMIAACERKSKEILSEIILQINTINDQLIKIPKESVYSELLKEARNTLVEIQILQMQLLFNLKRNDTRLKRNRNSA